MTRTCPVSLLFRWRFPSCTLRSAPSVTQRHRTMVSGPSYLYLKNDLSSIFDIMCFYLRKAWSEMNQILQLFSRLKKGSIWATNWGQTQHMVGLYPSCLWFVLLQWYLFISESSPFLSSIQESLSRLLLQMPSKYTFTELMDKWVKLYILIQISVIVLSYFYNIRNLWFIIAKAIFFYKFF